MCYSKRGFEDFVDPLNLSELMQPFCKDLMQFTSLLDKKGKDIYEGDIVNYDTAGFSGGLNGVVEWKDSGFYIARHIPLSQIIEKFKGDCEVIGNIYENPDLLK